MKISQLVLWTDVGFQDGSVEVPSVSNCQTEHLGERLSDLPDALAIYTDITPTKGRWFSEFKLKGKYSDLKKASYLRMTYDDAFYFGWIDSVELLNDTYVQVQGGDDLDFNEVRVTWHIDHWRTYLTAATFGYGIVERRRREEQDPIQNLSYRYRLPGDYTSMAFAGRGSESNWLIINHTKDTANGKLTEIRTMIIPISKDANVHRYYKDGESTVTCPTLGDVIEGLYTESLNVSPASVTSVFLSPIPPINIIGGDGTQENPYELDRGTSATETNYIDTRITHTSRNVSDVSVGYVSHTPGYFYYVVNYTDGTTDRSSNITAWGTIVSRIADKCAEQGVYTRKTMSAGSRRLTIDPQLNGSDVDVLSTRYIRLDDLVTAAKQGQIGDASVSGDYIEFVTDNVRVTSTAPSVLIAHTEITDASVTIDLTLTGDTVPGEYVYDGSTFGNVWVYITDNESVGIVYHQKTSSLKFQVYVDAHGYAYSKNQNYYEYSQTLPSEAVTTDTREWMFTDMLGNVIGALPWGVHCKDYTVRNVISAGSAYLEYRFNGLDSHALGTAFAVPLPPVDLTSNSWSDYVYSGQRDYDIQQRRIARDQALVSAVGGSITNAASGAMMGGLRESATFRSESIPTARSIGNMAGFGALGGVSGLMGAGLDYAAAGYFNDQLQGAQDQLSAKRIDSIMIPGQGWDWLWNGRACGLISMVPDNYSLDRFNESVRLSGITVSEPTDDCSLLIGNGGPLKISQLVVGGPIPVEARAYIKNRLADGVILKE